MTLSSGQWGRQIDKKSKENLKRIKDHRGKMKTYRDDRAGNRGTQLRSIKLTEEEKRELRAKLLESHGLKE